MQTFLRLTLQLSRDGKVFAAFCEPIDSVEEFSSDYSCYDSENEENVYDSENEENLGKERIYNVFFSMSNN
jgi:glutamyl/glutaminyl-tRNA synthetase